jgi:hypothetical protein
LHCVLLSSLSSALRFYSTAILLHCISKCFFSTALFSTLSPCTFSDAFFSQSVEELEVVQQNYEGNDADCADQDDDDDPGYGPTQVAILVLSDLLHQDLEESNDQIVTTG